MNTHAHTHTTHVRINLHVYMYIKYACMLEVLEPADWLCFNQLAGWGLT